MKVCFLAVFYHRNGPCMKSQRLTSSLFHSTLGGSFLIHSSLVSHSDAVYFGDCKCCFDHHCGIGVPNCFGYLCAYCLELRAASCFDAGKFIHFAPAGVPDWSGTSLKRHYLFLEESYCVSVSICGRSKESLKVSSSILGSAIVSEISAGTFDWAAHHNLASFSSFLVVGSALRSESASTRRS